MMLKQRFISKLFRSFGFLTVFFLLSPHVFSAESARKISGPIVITSEMLTADNKNNTAVFENSVVAKMTDMTLYADRMIVRYDKDTGNVTRIDAQGGVKFIKDDRIITSQEATYFAESEKVIFTGAPRAVQDENVVTGKKMTYLMNEDRFLVEDSKVFLPKKREP